MSIMRVRSVTSGLPGGPYLTTHYFDATSGVNADAAAAAVGDFWAALRDGIVSSATILIDSEVAVIDEATGDMLQVEGVSEPSVLGNDLNARAWTAKQGLMKLNTGLFRDSKRVQGRLFIPGISQGAGVEAPSAAYISRLTLAGATLRTAMTATNPWVVWSRPRLANPAKPQLPARAGDIFPVSSAVGDTDWAYLRSRRAD